MTNSPSPFWKNLELWQVVIGVLGLIPAFIAVVPIIQRWGLIPRFSNYRAKVIVVLVLTVVMILGVLVLQERRMIPPFPTSQETVMVSVDTHPPSLAPRPTLTTTTTTTIVVPSTVRFYDDFTGGDLTKWDVTYATEQVEIDEVNGNPALHILGNQTDYISLGLYDSFTDASILQARVQVVDFGTRDGSFNFNLMSELPGHGMGYSALIGPNGGAFLAERNNDFRGLISFDSRSIVLQPERWYTIRFEKRGSILTLTIDDAVIHRARVDSNQSGQPLFIFDRGMELYLDDVLIQ